MPLEVPLSFPVHDFLVLEDAYIQLIDVCTTLSPSGIICAEGEKWKRSRRFAASFLKTLGMVRFPGPRRDALEQRIMASVGECLEGFRSKAAGNVETEIDPLPEILHGMGNLMSDLVFGRTWKRNDPTWRWLQELQEKGTKMIGVAGPLNFLPFLR
ncbi:hypothetical protein J437_LFUL008693 [Ladona fulva]|uniref:Cytochrome P450 n=1 Tax=Ladona fulva TaxID=123851 RepID=A0A8K0K711_LADFU|nr:hypothetical protein J437_LFUL008693 [Ladona fulva]